MVGLRREMHILEQRKPKIIDCSKIVGINTYNFFVIPTINIENRYMNYTDITIEWLRFYVGIRIFNKENQNYH